jgi:hypothetical protein
LWAVFCVLNIPLLTYASLGSWSCAEVRILSKALEAAGGRRHRASFPPGHATGLGLKRILIAGG